MEESNTASTLSFSSFPIKKRIDPIKDKEGINYSINLITNLFQVSLIPDKLKNVFIFGVDVSDKTRDDEPKISLMRKCQRQAALDAFLKQYFDWYRLTGLSLFGSLKKDYLSSLGKFEVIMHIPSSLDKSASIIAIDQMNESVDSMDYVITLKFSQKSNINDIKHNDDQQLYSQIHKTLFNSIINKLLVELGFKKDCTSRKIVYYRESDMKQMKRVTASSNCPLYSFSALKANCDSYEGGNIYLKLLPKNILKSDERYTDLFSYLHDSYTEQAVSSFRAQVINQKGITTYSSTIVKIEDIEIANPYTLLFEEKGKESTSVGEYLVKRYGLDIKNTPQLMAVRYIDSNRKIPKDKAKKLYFSMKYLGVMGNPLGAKINIRDLIEKPFERLEKIKQKRAELVQLCQNSKKNEEGIEAAFDGAFNPVRVNAIVLKQPAIVFGNNIKVLPNENGRFELNGVQPFDSIVIKSIQVFLIGVDIEKGKHLYSKLQDASLQLNISLTKEPKIRQFNDEYSVPEYEKTFTSMFTVLAQEEKEKKEKQSKGDLLQLIFLFISSQVNPAVYRTFKNSLNASELFVTSQVIVYERTVKKNSSNLSPFTNIFSQIWAKMGQKLYCCDLSFAKNILVMAYAVTQHGNSTLTSLCFSLNDYKAQYCYMSDTSAKNDSRMSTILRPMIKSSISILWKNSRRKVETIVIYREGLNEMQLKAVKEIELRDLLGGIDDAISHIEQYADKDNKLSKQKGYWKEKPKLCLVIVNKFNDIKLFVEEKGDQMNVSKKFEHYDINPYQDSIKNIPVGTVVDREITNEVYFDFHLNSAHSSQGTNTPTHYVVVYDNTDMTAFTLINLTFTLTYLCYNTVQSIKVPAPLYFVVRRNQFIKDHLDATINKKMQIFNVSL